MKILITGGTGFIGSNITRSLLKCGHSLFLTYRGSSDFSRCLDFKNKVVWLNLEKDGFYESLSLLGLDTLIHCAWSGIGFASRNDWDLQLYNYKMSKRFFDIAKELSIKNVISLGSQSEYGVVSKKSQENDPTVPCDAYGAFKVLSSNYLKFLFENTDVSWFWLRIYTLFGEGENESWLLSVTIDHLIRDKDLELTKGGQVYNYMYIRDFLRVFPLLLSARNEISGVYNVCGDSELSVREILVKVSNNMGKSQDRLRFGLVPYRDNQNMYMTGSNRKFREAFDLETLDFWGIDKGLDALIKYREECFCEGR